MPGHYYPEALKFFELAVKYDSRNGYALMMLGFMVSRGFGCDPDQNLAIKYSKAAADAGEEQGAYNAGVLLENENDNEAYTFYQQAADNGHDEACYRFGLYLERVADDLKSLAESAEYFMRGHELGDAKCSYKVGMDFWLGKTFPKDRRKAIEFLVIASYGGCEQAVNFLDSNLSTKELKALKIDRQKISDAVDSNNVSSEYAAYIPRVESAGNVSPRSQRIRDKKAKERIKI